MGNTSKDAQKQDVDRTPNIHLGTKFGWIVRLSQAVQKRQESWERYRLAGV